MNNSLGWQPENQELLRYLHKDLCIFNWAIIAQEMKDRRRLNKTPAQCRDKFLEKYGPVIRGEWTAEEQRELYRLHNQNGNKWAIISQNLPGRSDNCVKNHFYSKLRKSLRTLNKAGKLYLRKCIKQVSDLVLYKLTQVTDQSLKQSTDIQKSVVFMSFALKNKLLQYEVDQKDLTDKRDYSFEKELLQGLNQFNRLYKKKPKKERVAFHMNDGAHSLSSGFKNNVLNSEEFENQESREQGSEPVNSKAKNIKNAQRQISFAKSGESQNDNQNDFNEASERYSECSRGSQYKRTVNYLIKAPPAEQQKVIESSHLYIALEGSQQALPSNKVFFSFIDEIRPLSRVQDILKAQGILQNGQYGSDIFFRGKISRRSFSICSDSSKSILSRDDMAMANDFKELQNESQSAFSQSQSQCR